jgi:hypothetical protein
VCNFKDRFLFFHVAFICHRCWGCVARSIILSYLSFLMAFSHQHIVIYEGACVPKPSFSDLFLGALSPHRTWNFINFLISVHELLPYSLSWSTLYSWHHKDGAPLRQ